jgi:hypothetical protein
MRISHILAFCAACFGFAPFNSSAQSFSDSGLGFPGLYQGSLAWGDYNHDGFPDLALLGNSTGGNSVAKLYRNDGSTNFVEVSIGLTPLYYGTVSWLDYNNDGWLDLFVTGAQLIFAPNIFAGRTYMFRNNGGGSFTSIGEEALSLPGAQYTSPFSGSVSWADYNNDGRADVLISGRTNDNFGQAYQGTWLFRQNQNGTFAFASAISARPAATAWGDYDNDGWPDLAYVDGSVSRIYRNNRNGAFSDSGIALPTTLAGVVAWGDYDNDGHLDLMLTGTPPLGSSGFVRVFRNNGNGTFSDPSITLQGGYYGESGWSDFDNDGWLDILASGRTVGNTLRTSVYRNNRDGTFTDINGGFPPLDFAATAVGDYNRDTKLDFVYTGAISNQPGYRTYLFRNNGSVSNTAPAPPTLLASAPAGASVTLTWSRGSDAETPANGLSYSLRVGTFSGGVQTVAPDSTATGAQRVPRYGNRGNSTQAVVQNLVRGTTYYWSVQSIDSGFLGSPFAPEQTFVILTPEVTTIGSSNVAYYTASLYGAVNPFGLESEAWFEYGPSNTFGTSTPHVSVGSGTTFLPINAHLSNLIPLTTYTFRAVARNNSGQTFGSTLSFVTHYLLPATPQVTRGLVSGQAGTKTLTLSNLANVSVTLAITFEGSAPSWVRLYTDTLNIGPNSTGQLSLTFDATGIANGTYQTTLRIDGGAGKPLLRVPVTLTVGPNADLAGDRNGDGIVDQAEFDAVYANYLPTSPWLAMTNVTGLGESNVTFALSNSVAGTYSVEASTNLLDWQFLGPAIPRFHFTDTNAPAAAQRSYRLRYP